MGLFWLGVAVLVFWGIGSLPPAEAGGLGPASFPKLLALSLLGLIVVYWFQSIKDAAISLRNEAGGSVLKAAALLALAYAAAFLWERAGALPVLVVFSVIELRWIEGFAWAKVMAVGMPLSIGMWLIFTQLLGVSLPLGLLMWFY